MSSNPDAAEGDELLRDRLEPLLGEADQIHLVDRKRHLADAEQRHDAGVTPGLRQNALPRIDQKHREVASRGTRRHVAGVLLVAGCVGDDEFAFRGGEIAVGDIDRDALLALRLQPSTSRAKSRSPPASAVLLLSLASPAS
jgi:hypothetical protein